MEFRVLGPLEVVAGDQPVALGSAQQRAVLAVLVVSAPEPVSRDRLIDELWGEHPPASAAHAVQVYVSGIRKMLRVAGDDGALRTSKAGYLLSVEPDQVDARRFERLAGEAQRLADDPGLARERFEEALGLWRGQALAGFEDVELVWREAERLGELRVLASEGLVEARLECGQHAEVIGQLTDLVGANPLRERPRRLLMVALYRSGRHAEALSAYRDACEALDEIGLQPGPELRELERAILRHDESLRSPDRLTDGSADLGSRVPAGSEGLDGVSATAEPSTAAVEVPESAQASALAGRRKVVTALFCAVAGSAALGEEPDPEVLAEVMGVYFDELRTTIERHGGMVAKFVGDAVIAVFGIPQVSEDDALRAVRAADEIRQRLPSVAERAGVKLSFRTAVNTGLVLVRHGENLTIGDAVNIGARLEHAAAPGEILLGEQTLRLVRDAVEVEQLEPLVVEGKSEPVSTFRLLGLDPLAPGLRRHLETPLVGRERELGLLQAAWDRAVEEPGCHLFTLMGAAGVGKSRLVAELTATLAGTATVITGRCLHYGEGITFWPLIEALTPRGEPAREVLDRLGGGGVASPEELFWEVRMLLESLALERPLVLHVDDLQWAESMLLDLIDHITDLSRDAPMLLLCSARPELLEDRPGWGGGKLNATTVLLHPLQAADCELLLDELGDGLPPDERARIITSSEGNPLFLEEMVTLAREDGTVAVPSTIQTLLAARLERLPIDEREVLERAAIEGEVFHRAALFSLLDYESTAELDRRLAALVRKDLIRSHAGQVQGELAFRFRHMLIRDAAYDALAKSTRAAMHQRFAGWLQRHAGDLAELDEIVGWHLEQAVRCQQQLGREPDAELAGHAAEHLHAAGRRAAGRGDLGAAGNLLERAHAVASDDRLLAARIGVDLAEQLIVAGDLRRADQLLIAAEREPESRVAAALVRLDWLLYADPHEATQTIEATVPALIEELTQSGDDRGLAKAHLSAVNMHWLPMRTTPAAEHAQLAAKHAREAGDERLRADALAIYVAALLYGPQDVETIKGELDEIERESPGRSLAARLLAARGQLVRLAGDFCGARELMQQALEGYRSLGAPLLAAVMHYHLAQLEMIDGHADAARVLLQEADATLAAADERSFRSTIQANLADANELLGDREAARDAVELSDQLSAPDDIGNFVITHPVRARLALAEGDAEAAERWARSAVEHASRTDSPLYQGQVHLELARVLFALGRPSEASSEAREALKLYQAKGDRPCAAAAKAVLDDAQRQSGSPGG